MVTKRNLLSHYAAGSVSLPFDFEVPVSFWKASDAPEGYQRRIGGIISTETVDRDGEIILQQGLDFGDFLRNGWFNDNHQQSMGAVLGYPELVQRFTKGDVLPDGSKATSNGTWAEGYLLNTKKADEVWELGTALQGTGRHLGYSVEGKILRRSGPGKRVIAKAKVKNVAITHCPVNEGSRLDLLAKSMMAMERGNYSDIQKALAVGTATPGVAPEGPQTGDGAGQVLATESLETDERKDLKSKLADDDDGETVTKSDLRALTYLVRKYPQISLAKAAQLLEYAKRLKRAGRI